jgi:hypothetical protein
LAQAFLSGFVMVLLKQSSTNMNCI